MDVNPKECMGENPVDMVTRGGGTYNADKWMF